jgi:hypothetical protein
VPLRTETIKLHKRLGLAQMARGVQQAKKVIADAITDIQSVYRGKPVGLGAVVEMLSHEIASLRHRKSHYDIVRKDHNKSAIWLESASDLNTAESRIEELTSFWPGGFQIMDQQNHQVVEEIISASDRNRGPISSTKRSL